MHPNSFQPLENYNLEIPFSRDTEWKEALPLIEEKKVKELANFIRLQTKKNGWILLGFHKNLAIFRKESRVSVWIRGTRRERCYVYIALDMDTMTVQTNFECPDEIDGVQVFDRVRKFLNTIDNSVVYANIPPFQVMRLTAKKGDKLYSANACFTWISEETELSL